MTVANAHTGISCPACKSLASVVKDSRPKDEGAYIRRRRCCEACGFRFTTHERAVDGEDREVRLAETAKELRALAVRLGEVARQLMDGHSMNGLLRSAVDLPDDEPPEPVTRAVVRPHMVPGQPYPVGGGRYGIAIELMGTVRLAPAGAEVWAQFSHAPETRAPVYWDPQAKTYNTLGHGVDLGWAVGRVGDRNMAGVLV